MAGRIAEGGTGGFYATRPFPRADDFGATNDDDRAVLKFMSADTAFSRALATTPDVPADRVEALRRAFDASLKDADLLAESAKAQRDLSADTGEQVQAVVVELINTPPAVIERTKAILSGATQVEQVKKTE